MTLPCNKLENVKRRAERARSGKTLDSIQTCPASRHVMLIADSVSSARKQPEIFSTMEDRRHCAASLYSVLESLWKSRAEIQGLRRELDHRSRQ